MHILRCTWLLVLSFTLVIVLFGVDVYNVTFLSLRRSGRCVRLVRYAVRVVRASFMVCSRILLRLLILAIRFLMAVLRFNGMVMNRWTNFLFVPTLLSYGRLGMGVQPRGLRYRLRDYGLLSTVYIPLTFIRSVVGLLV